MLRFLMKFIVSKIPIQEPEVILVVTKYTACFEYFIRLIIVVFCTVYQHFGATQNLDLHGRTYFVLSPQNCIFVIQFPTIFIGQGTLASSLKMEAKRWLPCTVIGANLCVLSTSLACR